MKKQPIGFSFEHLLDILTVNCIKRQVRHEAVNATPTTSLRFDQK
ncbi:SOS-response transcriptional repressor [Vibrio diabolicus]|uniref:SOS-response transcriptional repressor n=3 Tax=Vibrio TaxID=662 RepID=A0AAX1XH96_9VIBR|nr:SOS-response transcriptional repressor [Vibrio diabolicus]AVF77025.1 SOS-response transcriptional repressor [Vibrio alginolyticus]MDU9595831.1 SOS-response transcriptional repressor [Vibrio sp. 2-1-2a]MDU9605025.1 SOS-response transcriptional repressor [Vibrio sp. 1-2-3a]MPS41359.1 SOS-response transcriptional repressor [Vibrio sp. VGrn 2]NKJ70052.1 SOS-response transcriptional repressor [Vibrio chemaguriensis]NNN58928.1 SOS-response transcriptional repressor [Vibrio sp. 1-2 (7-a)]NNN8196